MDSMKNPNVAVCLSKDGIPSKILKGDYIIGVVVSDNDDDTVGMHVFEFGEVSRAMKGRAHYHLSKKLDKDAIAVAEVANAIAGLFEEKMSSTGGNTDGDS